MFFRPVFLLLGIFAVSLEICFCELSCDYFKTNSAQVEAGSSVTLRFTPNDHCRNKNNTVEVVTVLRRKDEPPHEHICSVTYKTGCKTFSNNCACGKQSQDFSVTWHTDGESQNETLLLSIRLQNDEERRQRIPVKLSSQQSQFTTVDPALSESETSITQGDATVSKGEPRFLSQGPQTFRVARGGELVVPFAFRAHTKQLTCQLIKLKGHRTNLPSTTEVATAKMNEGDVFHCPQPVNITGEPPNLRLNLDLKAIIQNDEGRWRLELANEIGVGHLDFEVVITDDTTEVIRDVPDKTGVTLPTQSGLVLIVAIGCVFLLVTVVIVSIVFGILFKRRATPPDPNNVRQEAGAVGIVFRPAPPAIQDNRGSLVSQGEHVYAEIPDDGPERRWSLSDSVRASYGSSVSDSESGGYLHPIAPSSSVSDSESGGCLHPIAPPSSLSDNESGGCLHPIGPPSSVDNQSDDYLHPVASSLERATAAHLTGAAADQPPVTNVSSMLAASKLESHYQNASCVLTAPKPERCCQNTCRRFTQPGTEPHYQIPKH